MQASTVDLPTEGCCLPAAGGGHPLPFRSLLIKDVLIDTVLHCLNLPREHRTLRVQLCTNLGTNVLLIKKKLKAKRIFGGT